MKSPFKINAEYVAREMLRRGLNSAQAAAKARLGAPNFSRILRGGAVGYVTAAKIQAAFGDDAIIFLHAQGK